MTQEDLARRLKSWEQTVLFVRNHTVEDVDACTLLQDAYQIIKEAFDCPMEYTLHSLSKGIVCPEKPCLTRAALAKQLATWRMQVLDLYDFHTKGSRGRIDHERVFTDVYRLQVTAANILEAMFGIRTVGGNHRIGEESDFHQAALKNIWMQLIKLQREIDRYATLKSNTASSPDSEIFNIDIYGMLENVSTTLDGAIQYLEDGINRCNDLDCECWE